MIPHNIEKYAPEFWTDVVDFDCIYSLENKELDELEYLRNTLIKNTFILDADVSGVERTEKMFKITPHDNESLEDSKFRLLTYYNGEAPYTKVSLKNKLENLCGIGKVYVEIDGLHIKVLVGLESKNRYDEVDKILQKWLPCNMVLELGLKFNSHEVLSKFTHGQLSQYTHKQLREDVLIGG